MCETCGFDDRDDALAKNQRQAQHNREEFERAGVITLNLTGSPGSGKTALVHATAQVLGGISTCTAINADLDTDHDARRLRAAGVPAVSVTPRSVYHVDASMVHDALDTLDWKSSDFLFVENVGTLVHPAIVDLGERVRVVTLSVTEGEDKPLAYPAMFRTADLVLLTKADLLPKLDVSVAKIRHALSLVMDRPAVLPLSVESGLGMGSWLAWLFDVAGHRRQRPPPPDANYVS